MSQMSSERQKGLGSVVLGQGERERLSSSGAGDCRGFVFMHQAHLSCWVESGHSKYAVTEVSGSYCRLPGQKRLWSGLRLGVTLTELEEVQEAS